MKLSILRSWSLLLVVALMLGCASSSETTEDEGEEGAMMQQELQTIQQARIFVDGTDRGLTPKTIRIDRRFGVGEVLLRIGKDRVRLFEVEQTASSNSAEMLYSFRGGNYDGMYVQLNVEDLPKKRKNDRYVYIPYTQEPMFITDRQYGLNIIVR